MPSAFDAAIAAMDDKQLSTFGISIEINGNPVVGILSENPDEFGDAETELIIIELPWSDLPAGTKRNADVYFVEEDRNFKVTRSPLKQDTQAVLFLVEV